MKNHLDKVNPQTELEKVATLVSRLNVEIAILRRTARNLHDALHSGGTPLATWIKNAEEQILAEDKLPRR